MFKFCQGCRKRLSAPGFCLECRQDLLQADTQSSLKYEALYQYRSPLRESIMRAKVKNDRHALEGLTYLFVGHEDVLSKAAESDVIVPAASSLWGRMRGRFDLAQAMALELGHETGRRVELLPWRCYMNLAKRAGSNEVPGESGLNIRLKKSNVFREQRVLLVDDVITTGKTMGQTLAMITALGAKKVTGLALASSTSLA